MLLCANSTAVQKVKVRPSVSVSYGQEYLINKVASLHDNVAVVNEVEIDFAIGAECTSYFDGMVSGQEGGRPCRNHYGKAAMAKTVSIEENGKIIRYMVIIMTIAMYLINGCSMPKVFS